MMLEMPRCVTERKLISSGCVLVQWCGVEQHTLWAALQMLSLNSDAEL
jgi:hypothetical protein